MRSQRSQASALSAKIGRSFLCRKQCHFLARIIYTFNQGWITDRGDEANAVLLAPSSLCALTRRALIPALIVVCLGASAFVAFAVAKQMAQNSDNVQSFLAAQSVLHGNVMLSGWHLARDDFFFTDTLPMAAMESLFGFRHMLIAVFPAVVYVLTVAASIAAALAPARSPAQRLAGLAAIVIFIGLPSIDVSLPLLQADAHGASILFSLVALMSLAALAEGQTRRQLPIGLAFIVLTSATVASDPYTLIFAFGPALLVLALEYLAEQHTARALFLLGLTAFSSALGALAPSAIAYFGGFVTEPTVSVQFVAAHKLGATLVALFFGLVYISGADIFARDLFALATFAKLARLIVWTFGGAALVRRIPVLCRGERSCILDRFLLASILIVALASVMSQQYARATEGPIFIGGSGNRYLMPILVFGAILAARALPAMLASLPTQRFRSASLILLLVLATGLIADQSVAATRWVTSPSWMSSTAFAKVAQWLEARRLTCGVGEYWTSSIITALSDGSVTVRPATAPPGGRLAPLLWLSDAHWYHGAKEPRFAIWRAGDPGLRHFNLQTLTATYGPTLRIKHVAGFTIALLPQPPAHRGLTLYCASKR